MYCIDRLRGNQCDLLKQGYVVPHSTPLVSGCMAMNLLLIIACYLLARLSACGIVLCGLTVVPHWEHSMHNMQLYVKVGSRPVVSEDDEMVK